MGLTEKECKGPVWGDGVVTYLDWGVGRMGVYTHPNLSNCTLTMRTFHSMKIIPQIRQQNKITSES